MSDLHIGAGKARSRRLKAQVSDIIRAYSPENTIILVAGDLTEGVLFGQWRHWPQMDEVTRLLMPLVVRGYKVVVVPGNHDLSPKGATMITSRHVEEFGRRVLGPLMPWAVNPWEPVLDMGDVRVIGLNSMRGQYGMDVDLARGRLGGDELERLATALTFMKPTQQAVVLLHHSFFYDRWSNRLEDEDEYLKVLAECGRVAYQFNGHEHRWRMRGDLPGVELAFGSPRTTDRGERFTVWDL